MNSWSNNWTSGWNTGYDLSRSADGTFTWTGNLTTDTIFRFCLVDSSAWTGGDKWATCWYKSDSDNLPVSPGTPYSLNYVHYQNAGNRNWLISPAGNYTITVDAGTNLMRVTKN